MTTPDTLPVLSKKNFLAEQLLTKLCPVAQVKTASVDRTKKKNREKMLNLRVPILFKKKKKNKT